MKIDKFQQVTIARLRVGELTVTDSFTALDSDE